MQYLIDTTSFEFLVFHSLKYKIAIIRFLELESQFFEVTVVSTSNND